MRRQKSTRSLKTPIIGVFVSRNHIRKLHLHDPSFMSSFRYIRYIELAKAGLDANVTLYFFSSKNVHRGQSKITGTYYSPQYMGWKQAIVPFPDVLYDRGGGGRNKSAQSIRRIFEKKGIQKINAQHYFDKWDLYRQLSKVKALRAHLPFTVKGNVRQLKHMFTGSHTFYVKVCTGSCGKGVVRVTPFNQKKVQYSYLQNGQVVKRVGKLNHMLQTIRSFFKQKEIIIQEAIKLPRRRKGIIDMRAEVQRNARGNIEVTGITVRIGRPHAPIASNTLDSDYYSFKRFCKEFLSFSPEEIKTLRSKINAFLLQVYQGVECRYGSFGELGIDFGWDKEGQLWLIECNAKSAKMALYHAYSKKTIRKAFRNPLEYAKLLARKRMQSITTDSSAQIGR